jgi:radical SAM superfamily enzyme with C-terminal helix-hairpin-helix motif
MFRKFLSIIVLIIVTIVFVTACSPTAQTAATIAPTVTTLDSATAVENTTTSEEATQAGNNSVLITCVKLNLNDLTEDELMSTIPNFTSRMVREFFEYRPYVSIQQFRREIGKYVDETQVTEWEQYVYVPVSPNDSDAETLMQLPGVDETIAATLIEGRPYVDNGAFLGALAAVVTAEQTAEAACYLAA